jgi:hypothetical protein
VRSLESFPALLARLYDERYTGAVVIQFGSGVPAAVEFPQPPVTIRLDKPPKLRKDLTSTVIVAPDPRDFDS